MNVLVKDINYEINREYADINKIDYIYKNGQYHIIVEYSRLPIESFNTENQAIDFLIGYLTDMNKTEEMKLGRLFRYFIVSDISNEVQLSKVREI